MSHPATLHCPHCAQLLTFEADACHSCARPVGFDPAAGAFLSLAPEGGWQSELDAPQALVPCDNRRLGVCNWLFAPEPGRTMCDSCRHNRTIPDLGVPGVLERWAKVEAAKKRCIHALIRLGVPAEMNGPNGPGLVFDLLYDPSAEQGYAPSLMTGHLGGLITLNLIEADDAARERMRSQFGEPYRTLVGHFRHEIGHHYWDRLVAFTPDLEPFRALFGDEQADYGSALAAYHANGPAAGWEENYVSRYATAHPWEDFAETFAHYLHIVDTLDTIGRFGVSIDAPPGAATDARPTVDFDPFTADTASLIAQWIPLAFALNAINRSMGQPDLYPFRVTPQVVLKLDFVNRLLAFGAGRWTPGEAEGASLKAMMATLGHGVELAG